MGVFFDDDIVICETKSFMDRFSQGLQTLRIDKDFTDFTLKTGEKIVECHRVVIATHSPVLKSMLKSPMKETTEKQIELNNISPQAMDNIVEYMYSGRTTISKDTLRDVIEAADFLQMDELKQLCIDQAPAVFEPHNVISWFKFSTKLDLIDLHIECSKIMTTQLDEIKSGKEFLELKISELNSYIDDLKQNDADPDDMLGASLDWVHADPENRGEEMEELLAAVPLEQCSYQCLEEEEQKHQSLLDTNLGAQIKLVQALKVLRENGVPTTTRRKKESDPFYLLIGGGGWNYRDELCWLLDSTFSLTPFCDIPEQLKGGKSHFSICKTPEGFILTDSDFAMSFNVKKRTWKKLPEPIVERFGHGSAFVKNILFIFGGEINDCLSSSVHYLDDSGSWQVGPNIPAACHYPEVVNIGEEIFLMDTYRLNGLYKLKVSTMEWSNLAALPPWSKLTGARMIQVNDRLYLAGGYYNCSIAWYTPSTNTWRSNASPHQLQHHLGAMLHHDNTILFLGGWNQEKVESFDLDTGVWSVCDWEVPKQLEYLHCLKFA